MDENEHVKYPRRIYLLHPLHKTRTNAKLDVVFLHGLLGGVFVTWRQRDSDTSAFGVVGLLVLQINKQFVRYSVRVSELRCFGLISLRCDTCLLTTFKSSLSQ